MTFSPPTAEQQIIFLHDLQRIIEEGDFSATYKFALLMALAEIAVEAGNDSGLGESIPARPELSPKCIEDSNLAIVRKVETKNSTIRADLALRDPCFRWLSDSA